MEAILLVLALLVIAAVLLFPIWRRSAAGSGCGPCAPSVPAPSSGVCFPSIPWTVKSGIIDLRGCNDDIYLFARRSQIHFVEETS